MNIRSVINFLRHKFQKRPVIQFLGDNSNLPYDIIISGPENIIVDENCKIGSNTIIFATHAKVHIKKYFLGANGLHIIAGSHERRIGRFCADISDSEKRLDIGLDKDITINEDVWCGMNVSILRGVNVARGSTIATGSVVTKSTPPYSLNGGVPSHFIKFYWTIDQILEHESKLYPLDERYTREELEEIFAKYQK